MEGASDEAGGGMVPAGRSLMPLEAGIWAEGHWGLSWGTRRQDETHSETSGSLLLEPSLTLSWFSQSTLAVRRTMAAAPTCACCPQGSLSIHVPVPRVCSCRTTAGRVRQVSRRDGTGQDGAGGARPGGNGLRPVVPEGTLANPFKMIHSAGVVIQICGPSYSGL